MSKPKQHKRFRTFESEKSVLRPVCSRTRKRIKTSLRKYREKRVSLHARSGESTSLQKCGARSLSAVRLSQHEHTVVVSQFETADNMTDTLGALRSAPHCSAIHFDRLMERLRKHGIMTRLFWTNGSRFMRHKIETISLRLSQCYVSTLSSR